MDELVMVMGGQRGGQGVTRGHLGGSIQHRAKHSDFRPCKLRKTHNTGRGKGGERTREEGRGDTELRYGSDGHPGADYLLTLCWEK